MARSRPARTRPGTPAGKPSPPRPAASASPPNPATWPPASGPSQGAPPACAATTGTSPAPWPRTAARIEARHAQRDQRQDQKADSAAPASPNRAAGVRLEPQTIQRRRARPKAGRKHHGNRNHAPWRSPQQQRGAQSRHQARLVTPQRPSPQPHVHGRPRDQRQQRPRDRPLDRLAQPLAEVGDVLGERTRRQRQTRRAPQRRDAERRSPAPPRLKLRRLPRRAHRAGRSSSCKSGAACCRAWNASRVGPTAAGHQGVELLDRSAERGGRSARGPPDRGLAQVGGQIVGSRSCGPFSGVIAAHGFPVSAPQGDPLHVAPEERLVRMLVALAVQVRRQVHAVEVRRRRHAGGDQRRRNNVERDHRTCVDLAGGQALGHLARNGTRRPPS